MRYAYYPGCSLHVGSKEYDMSWRAVCQVLGIELAEMEDWNCCGTVHASSVNAQVAHALAARNLSIAEEMGLDIVAACSGCYKNLRATDIAFKSDRATKERVNSFLPTPYEGSISVKHPLYLIVNDLGLEALPNPVRPLHGLRVAPYYGCVLTRPLYLEPPDHPEQPTGLDRLLTALGAEVIPYPSKTKCCGGAVLLSHTDVSVELCSRLLKQAKDLGANCLAVACPMCQLALDGYQPRAEKLLREQLDMPILYFTQLMGLAFGIDPKRLGFQRLFVSPSTLLARV